MGRCGAKPCIGGRRVFAQAMSAFWASIRHALRGLCRPFGPPYAAQKAPEGAWPPPNIPQIHRRDMVSYSSLHIFNGEYDV